MDHFYTRIKDSSNTFGYLDFYSSVVQDAKDGYHFVEVGSWRGASSVYMAVEIINSKKNIKFDCIDIWQIDNNIQDVSKDQLDPNSPAYDPIFADKDGLYNHFIENIKPVKEAIKVIRKPSVDAAKLYQDESLNFVYIDANHDYKYVYADIKTWLPKIKKGGVISGHDINQCPGVGRAVKEIIGNDFNQLQSQNVWYYKVKKL